MKRILHKGFNPAKCKTSLKMAVSRVKLLRNKKEIQLRQLKREVAQLLETGQEQTARIRVEHVVREEKTIAAYDLIDVYCELIVARLPIIESQKNCPIDLKEPIASVIFASPRCSDILELMDVRKHFTAKYGKEFVTAAMELHPGCGVNRTLIEKLSASSPDGPTKVKILTGIAEEHNIKWEPNWFKDNEPEPPAYLPNEPNVDKVSQTHVETLSFQAAPSFEPKHEIPSNVHHIAGSEMNNPKFVYSAATPSGTKPETAEFHQSSGVEDTSLVARQKWNMEFKDASAAAHAAAESAELASMAARAAAELASQGKGNFMDHTTADLDFVQNEGNRGQMKNTDQGGLVDKFPTDNSFSERPSRQMQRDPNQQVKTSGTMDENSFKKEYHLSGMHDRPNSFQRSSSPMKASVQKDANQQYTEKVSTSKVISETDNKQSMEYDEVQNDVQSEDEHYSSPEDPEFSRSTSNSRLTHNAENEIFSYSNFQHDDGTVEHPLYEETGETRNHSGIYWSESGGFSENDGIISNSNLPKYDSDLNEDPFDSTGHGNFCKEDLETKQPSSYSAFHSTVFLDQKDDFLEFSEQRKYGFEPHKHSFIDADAESGHMDEGSTNTDINNGAPVYDDYVAGEGDHIQSPGGKSPAYSSPDEDSMPKKWGISSSKHLYQPELSESFKNSPLYSELVKPVILGDDSDQTSSENDEEVQKSRIGRRAFAIKVLHNPQEPETEHRDPDEHVRSSYAERGTSSFIPEQSTVGGHSEEGLEKGFGASIIKNDSDDLSTTQQSSRHTRSNSHTKSIDRQSFSRLPEEAERLSSPQASSLQATPDVIDDSKYSYQSNSESSTELNVESLPGGLRNTGYRRPTYSRGKSNYPSSYPILTADDTPKTRQTSSSSSSEIKELSSQNESINRNKTSGLQGTYFDPNGDSPVEDAEWKGLTSVQNSSDRRNFGNVNEKSSSRVPQSYFDSEDINSGEEVVKQTVSSKVRPGYSRRTRASGLGYATGSHTETKASYDSSGMEPVSEKKPSSSTLYAVDTSVKPKTKPASQTESSKLPRRKVDNSSPSDLPKMSSGEKISAPSIAGKQATSLQEGTSGADTAEVPRTSSSSEKTMLRDNSDKKASHVHPKLPDYDDFASHFQSLRKNRQ